MIHYTKVFFIASLILLLSACSSAPSDTSGFNVRPFSLSHLVKSDIDMVAEISLRQTLENLRTLMEKLYRRNPAEWRKGYNKSLEAAVTRVFGRLPEIDWAPRFQGEKALDSMRFAFDESFHGDRVYAFIAGLGGMILDSYNGKKEFYLLDKLDPQKLYHAARNIEVAAWKLTHDQDANNQLFLVSNELVGPVKNLSFERQFGKLIALQDSMAQVVADATNRQIRSVFHTVATMVFIPI